MATPLCMRSKAVLFWVRWGMIFVILTAVTHRQLVRHPLYSASFFPHPHGKNQSAPVSGQHLSNKSSGDSLNLTQTKSDSSYSYSHRSINNKLNYERAIQWIEGKQHPASCDQATILSIGTPGGFGSNLQRAGVMLLEVLASESVAVIVGHYSKYTQNQRCQGYTTLQSKESLTCFFAPITNCSVVVVGGGGGGGEVKVSRMRDTQFHGRKGKEGLAGNIDTNTPTMFCHLGPMFWWGAVQGYLFRFNSRMKSRLAEIKSELKYTRPSISAHIRLGDKLKDRDSNQNKGESIETLVKNYLDQINIFANRVRLETHVHECHTTCPTPATSPASRTSPASPASLALNETCHAHCDAVVAYIATDSVQVATTLRRWGVRENIVVMVRTTVSQSVSNEDVAVADVIRDHPDKAYLLAEEVIIDTHLLIGARFFVGLCMSQIARVVVAIGFAQGSLEEAVAIDAANLHRADKLKLKSGDRNNPWRKPQTPPQIIPTRR